MYLTEQQVRHAVKTNMGERLNGFYYHEELAGPDGMSVVLFVTEGTTGEAILSAQEQAHAEGDVVSFHAQVVPERWLMSSDTDTQVSADIHALRQIVETHTAGTLRWDNGETLLVDVTTAGVLVQVYDAVSDEVRKKLRKKIQSSKVDFLQTIDAVWRVVS